MKPSMKFNKRMMSMKKASFVITLGNKRQTVEDTSRRMKSRETGV